MWLDKITLENLEGESIQAIKISFVSNVIKQAEIWVNKETYIYSDKLKQYAILPKKEYSVLPSDKIYVDAAVDIPRRHISKKFHIVRSAGNADIVCIPKLVNADFIGQFYLYLFSTGNNYYVVDIPYSISQAMKVDVGTTFSSILNEYQKIKNPVKVDGSISDIINSTCIYRGNVFYRNKKNNFIFLIAKGEYKRVIEQQDLLNVLSEGEISSERINSIKKMLSSPDIYVRISALRILAELPYMKYKMTFKHILSKEYHRIKHLPLTGQIKAMLKHLDVKDSFFNPEEPASKQDADAFQEFLEEIIKSELSEIERRIYTICDIDFNYKYTMKYKK